MQPKNETYHPNKNKKTPKTKLCSPKECQNDFTQADFPWVSNFKLKNQNFRNMIMKNILKLESCVYVQYVTKIFFIMMLRMFWYSGLKMGNQAKMLKNCHLQLIFGLKSCWVFSTEFLGLTIPLTQAFWVAVVNLQALARVSARTSRIRFFYLEKDTDYILHLEIFRLCFYFHFVSGKKSGSLFSDLETFSK